MTHFWMKDSEVLKIARTRIANRSELYICCAIKSACKSTAQEIALKRWVEKMLGNALYYEEWLAVNHRQMYIRHRFDRDWMRNARLAWLDWMIAYCEQEEA